MNGFVKTNMDTNNFPEKMSPMYTKTTPKYGLKKHCYLHILMGISSQFKKKLTPVFQLQKETDKTTETRNVNLAKRKKKVLNS